VLISSKELEANYLDLVAEDGVPVLWSAAFCTAGYPHRMPNCYCAIAQGNPIYVSFLDHFGDDVSGNRSKSWNKHNNSYITHCNLPRKLLQQEFHVHLVATSQHAVIAEQFGAIKNVVEETHTHPVQVQDEDGLTTCFMLRFHAEPSDNPAQSSAFSHIGALGNHLCRKCEVGRSEAVKASDNGFYAMFLVGDCVIVYIICD
jgi:hypothetical protein